MRVYFRVSGRVQGIGYRYFVLETAEKLQLSGWVRNLAGGDVEGEAEGESLSGFLDALRNEHPYARVDSLVTRDLPPKNDSGFKIIP